jgi:hypothetical protein
VKINITIKFLKTRRAPLIILISLILFTSFPLLCHSQDLYSLEQSQKYAEYLFSSKQHILAAEEYERLVFFDGNNVSFKYRLVRSYRLSGNLNTGIKRLYSFYGDSLSSMPQPLATEFIKMQLLEDSISVTEDFIRNSKTFSPDKKAAIHSCDLLLGNKYKEAGIYVKQAAVSNITLPANIIRLTERAENVRFKSPFLAAGLSAVIPGTGKFYTKNWSDGIFSLLFVASNAWQAYRGFNRDGIKSAYGWVFSGLTASFYIGNIFGSVKAVKRYNTIKKNEISNQVYDLVRSDSF